MTVTIVTPGIQLVGVGSEIYYTSKIKKPKWQAVANGSHKEMCLCRPYIQYFFHGSILGHSVCQYGLKADGVCGYSCS